MILRCVRLVKAVRGSNPCMSLPHRLQPIPTEIARPAQHIIDSEHNVEDRSLTSFDPPSNS